MKLFRNIFIILIILTVAVIVGVMVYTNGRTFYNESEEVGNTAGNLYNGGLFCVQDGKIFFSNDAEDGSLYVMNSDCSNIKKVHNDKAVYINADENYVYYVRANNTKENNVGAFVMFFNTGVYRINRNGSNLKAISGDPGAYLTLKGNTLYFQRYNVDSGLYLYQYQIDGTAERLLYKDAVVPAIVKDNSLFYVGKSEDTNINIMDLSSFTYHTAFEGSFAYPIFLDNYIYYIDMVDGYHLYRMNQDGSNPTLLVKERCSTYNITNTGKYLYYQIDDGTNSGICRLSLETFEAETLMAGNYKQINVTDNYVFFKDFDNTNTYVVAAEGGSDISTFNPAGADSAK